MFNITTASDLDRAGSAIGARYASERVERVTYDWNDVVEVPAGVTVSIDGDALDSVITLARNGEPFATVTLATLIGLATGRPVRVAAPETAPEGWASVEPSEV